MPIRSRLRVRLALVSAPIPKIKTRPQQGRVVWRNYATRFCVRAIPLVGTSVAGSSWLLPGGRFRHTSGRVRELAAVEISGVQLVPPVITHAIGR